MPLRQPSKAIGYGLVFLSLVNFFNILLLVLRATPINTGVFLQLALAMVLLGLGVTVLRPLPIRINKGIKLTVLLLLLPIFLSFVIIESLIVYSSVEDADKVSPDYLIILGSGIKGSQISLQLQERLQTGLAYAQKYKQIKVILSGGKGPGEDIAEAEAMRRFLLSRGLDKNRIITEEKSTSTFENLKYSGEILTRLDGRKNLRLVVVTSDYHLFRAKFLAKRFGYTAFGLPAHTPIWDKISCYLREYLAVIKSLLLDNPAQNVVSFK